MENLKNAYFAGGCFWCLEGIFEAQNGVKEAIAGYIGGTKETATYNLVHSGKTEHREGIKVIYNPEIISYETLVEIFWRQIDPTDEGGQFADIGYQYTTAIYYSDDIEKLIASTIKLELEDSGKFDKKIATKIIPFTTFFDAEEYHQDYYKTNPTRYKLYSKGSGRDDYKDKIWGDYKVEKKENLREKLTPLQYKVTQEGGTEPAFDNEYWNVHDEGIYVDIVDGTPLFSSKDKYDSGTGWPSFTKPIDENFIEEEDDYKLFSKRTEVKTTSCHLGHVFEDGPMDKGGQRFCINSAALKFIPKDELKGSKYEKYLELFNK